MYTFMITNLQTQYRLLQSLDLVIIRRANFPLMPRPTDLDPFLNSSNRFVVGPDCFELVAEVHFATREAIDVGDYLISERTVLRTS